MALLFNPMEANAFWNSRMLLARTGSEQLIKARTDERSYCAHCALGGAAGNELEGKVRHPRQRALIFADNLQHGFWMHHPIQRRLHHHGQVANHGQHKAGNQSHVVVQRQPAVNAVRRRHLFSVPAPDVRVASARQHG